MKKYFKKSLRPCFCIMMAALFVSMAFLDSFAVIYSGRDVAAKTLYDISSKTVINSKNPFVYTQNLSSYNQTNVTKFSFGTGSFIEKYPTPNDRSSDTIQGAYYSISTIDNPKDRLVIQGRASYDTLGKLYTVSKSGFIRKNYSKSLVAMDSDGNEDDNYKMVVKLYRDTDYYICTLVEDGKHASYQLTIEPNIDETYSTIGGKWTAIDKYVENGIGGYTYSIFYYNREQTAQLYNVLCAINTQGTISGEALNKGPWGIFREFICNSSMGWSFVSTFVDTAALISLGLTAADLALSYALDEAEQEMIFNEIDNELLDNALIKLASFTLDDVQSLMYDVYTAGNCDMVVGYCATYYTAENGIALTEKKNVYTSKAYSYYDVSSYDSNTLKGARFAYGRWVNAD